VTLCVDCQRRAEHTRRSGNPACGFTMRIGTGVHF
jgi:hypothetical protein